MAVFWRFGIALLAAWLGSAAFAQAQPASSTQKDVPLIAAASDLQYVLPKLAAQFQQTTGRQVSLSFGASGNLARQIAQGGPYQLFFSADEAYLVQLTQQGFAKQPMQLYAIGQLVLWVPHSAASVLPVEQGLAGVQKALAANRLERLAIANPAIAPYGKAAQQALEKAGVWQALQGKLVQGENIAQAAQFAASGSTQGGLLALSLAVTPAMQAKGRYVLIPTSQYAPLRQSMLLLKNAGDTAEKFYQFVQQPAARQLLREHGLGL